MKPPSEVMSSLLSSKTAYEQAYKHGGAANIATPLKSASDMLIEKNSNIQKSTKVMETELRSL